MKTPKELLELYGLRANRSLGQNFLSDRSVCRDIAEACRTEPVLPALEAGPGLGALTGELLRVCGRVVAVEKDGRLAEVLKAEYPEDSLRVVHGDFLKFPLKDAFGQEPFVCAGNLPYYVTTPIAERILCGIPERAVLMVQLEAAQRFTALPGDRVYGPVAVLSRTLYDPEILFRVSRDRFWPQPNVDSAVVRLIRKQDSGSAEEAERLLGFCRKCFAMRRKTIRNHFSGDGPALSVCEETGIAGMRIEQLEPDRIRQLYNRIRERECLEGNPGLRSNRSEQDEQKGDCGDDGI